jgi:phosphotransferase system enzyme I (PtsI)
MLSLFGTGIGRHIAIGRAVILGNPARTISRHLLTNDQIDDEISRLRFAVNDAREGLMRLADNLPLDAPPETQAFIDVHLLMLDDPVISTAPINTIREQKKNAEWALKLNADKLIAFFEGIEDSYLRSKQNDVIQVVDRILLSLQQAPAEAGNRLANDLAGHIVVATDLTPADTVMLRHRHMTGFVTRFGGPISHTAILARSLRVPAVLGLHGTIDYIRNDDLLVIDGVNNTVLVAPDETLLVEFQHRRDQAQARTLSLQSLQTEKAQTQDGCIVRLLANVELPEDLDVLPDAGADGIGLYRTEFLFMNAHQQPSESEQYDAYCQVLKHSPGPVAIRTLDLGADKQVDGGRSNSQNTVNPALGLRAIRLCLREPDLFKPQLRAIFRAAITGQATIMIPMLSSLSELDQTLMIIDEVKDELSREGVPFESDVPIGGMIEVPAAAIAADLFARKLDFLSIGTNDLIQYTLAIDRIDDEVNYLYNPLHPAVLRLIHQIIQAGATAGIPVSLCGEMAGDPDYTRLLLGLGLREFSMECSSLPEIKQRIRESDINAQRATIEKILTTSVPSQLDQLIAQLNDGTSD